jgi:hypothetical protein
MNGCNHNEALHPTRMDIPLEIRGYVIQLLNQTLAFTVDLRSHVKQAGWNVKGQDFAACRPSSPPLPSKSTQRRRKP